MNKYVVLYTARQSSHHSIYYVYLYSINKLWLNEKAYHTYDFICEQHSYDVVEHFYYFINVFKVCMCKRTMSVTGSYNNNYLPTRLLEVNLIN